MISDKRSDDKLPRSLPFAARALFTTRSSPSRRSWCYIHFICIRTGQRFHPPTDPTFTKSDVVQTPCFLCVFLGSPFKIQERRASVLRTTVSGRRPSAVITATHTKAIQCCLPLKKPIHYLDEKLVLDQIMIEVVLNDRLGKKVRVKCNEDDTIGDLKKLAAAQLGTRPEKLRIQKWYTVYKDHITLEDYEIHDGMGLELYYQ